MESVVGASTAQAGSERLDDCFERCEQIATPSGLLAGEFGFDGGEDVGQYVQVDARIKASARLCRLNVQESIEADRGRNTSSDAKK